MPDERPDPDPSGEPPVAPVTPPAVVAAAGPDDDEERQSPLRVFLGLFVVPLVVVAVCVAIFAGFGWLAYEGTDVDDYVNDLQSGWRPRRAQAAYELSKILLADPEALADDPGARAEMRRLFAGADDETMRRYLALVLGRTRDPEAVPLLLEALADADSQTRIYALLALGAGGDSRAAPAVSAALADADPGIRKTAAYALGELGGAGAATALAPVLADPVPDVRWNAALALARLGGAAGAPVLRQMLDRSLTAQVPGITPAQQEEAMVSAVAALAAVDREGSAELLARLAAEDPSLKVRQAALAALAP